MEKMKSTPIGVAIFYLMIMVVVSSILIYLGNGLVIVLQAINSEFLSPLFGYDLGVEGFLDVAILYLGPIGIIFAIAALIGYTLPITVLTLVFIFIDHLIGFSKRLPSLWLFVTLRILNPLLKKVGIDIYSGDVILENRLNVKNDDIATTKGFSKAFLANSKRTLLIPASIAALLWVFVGGDYAIHSPIVFLGNIVISETDQNLLLYFLLIIIPILFTLLIFPSISVLEQAGLRIVKYSSQKEVGNITNLGESLFSLIGNVFGVSAILLLSSRMSNDLLEWNVSNAELSTIEVFLLNLFLVFPSGLMYAIANFLVLFAFFIPSACILLFYLYPTKALEAVKHVRAKLQQKDNIIISAVVLKTFSDDSSE